MSAYRKSAVCLAVSFAVLLLEPVSSGFAQDSTSYEQRIDALERRVDMLETMIAQLMNSPSAGQVPLNQTGNPWRSLQKGMTEEQVIALLGQPKRIDRGIGLDFFHYGNGLDQVVQFDSDSGTVNGWRE